MKIFKKLLALLLIAIVIYAISYTWRALPIISGYGAKILCSCTMLAGRDHRDVIANELGRFPISLGKFEVDYEDSSATASVFGMARKKAIYRKGLGCTIINEISEEEIRQQHITTARPPNIDQDTIAWPMGNMTRDSVFHTINYLQLNATIDSAFNEPGPEKLRRTRAVIVLYDGQIIAERYADGFDKNSLLIGWSMTKSLTNAVVGLLVHEGKLKLDAPAPVSRWEHDARSMITLHHLLQASSGLEWVEDYGSPGHATNMLFKKKDAGLYAAATPAAHEPGKFFQYSSGTSNIVSRIVRETLGDSVYYQFPFKRIFYKTGMYSLVIEPDAGGTFVGSSFSFATARDWARFGLLYMQDGMWNGERILPEGWVQYTTTPAPAAPQGKYGAHFWLNAGDPAHPEDRLYPSAPKDMFWADGYEGQNVFIMPSQKLVVVKLSLTHGNFMDDDKFLAEIIEAVE